MSSLSFRPAGVGRPAQLPDIKGSPIDQRQVLADGSGRVGRASDLSGSLLATLGEDGKSETIKPARHLKRTRAAGPCLRRLQRRALKNRLARAIAIYRHPPVRSETGRVHGELSFSNAPGTGARVGSCVDSAETGAASKPHSIG